MAVDNTVWRRGRARRSIPCTCCSRCITTGGTSVVAGLLGRGVLTADLISIKKSNQQSAENVAKGVGTKAEKELIDTVYEGLKGLLSNEVHMQVRLVLGMFHYQDRILLKV